MNIAIIILSMALIAIIFAVIWARSKGTKINSFWDVVRNPDTMPDLDQIQRDVENRALAISVSEEEIAKLVDYFVFDAKSSDDAWIQKRIIAKLGEATYPRALEILCDKSTYDRLVVLSDHEASLPEAPICRLAKIFDLETPPPREAAKLLTPFLRSDAAEIRKSVALVIGSIGSSQSLPDMQRAVHDEDDYVKSFALRGIQRAIAGGRISQTDKGAYYELVAEMWPKDTSFNVCDQIPNILLSLDRGRAVERLLQPDLFTLNFEPAWRILETFARESLTIPRTKLLDLINEASKEPIKYPMDNVLNGALFLLAQHRSKEDLATLERLVDHSNKKVSRGAIQGLYFYHGYFDLIRDPWDVVESHGWNALTDSEKHICAIEELNGEVNNGGFAPYYFNSSGNHWRDALNGLAAIGAAKHEKIMADTIEKFDQSTPSPVRQARNSQLSKIVREKEDPFNEQDTAWYNTKDEQLDRLMFRYNLANTHGRNKSEHVGGK